MTIGFRICKRRRAVDAAAIAGFRQLPVANVSDCMSRMSAAGARLRPFYSGGTMCGPALTVRTRPGDNLMVHKALDLAAPGDIIVVDAGGDLSNALIGELMLAQAARSGVGGLVINGAIRDVAALRAQPLPVFAAGVTHRGPYKDGPGEINVAVAIDGMVVEPGDLVLGDEDGVLCIPYDQVATIREAAERKQAAEAQTIEQIAAGTLDRSWIDAALARLGCERE